MNVKINIGKVISNVNIIENDEEALKEKNIVIDGMVKKILEHPEQGEKARQIGEEKLRKMALKIFDEKMKENNEKEINEALEMAKTFNQAIIEGLVKGATEIAKKL
ncbi:hypothetical protein FIA58_020595 [Flavobacterium jejuense]|uniref:Uncharacterized protein n=1 Tax=Flavobacterium jejuense TaxID=1544455 RepID=A0ABX0IZ26_9FLAO|nr:hypothetical protein [Flavobacterium jejuense]NHN28084.1 hypothetical protein [Flavobacterium jejuense]